MDDGPWLYYKLTNEPKGSGELIIHAGLQCNSIANNHIDASCRVLTEAGGGFVC